jgi:galactokinase
MSLETVRESFRERFGTDAQVTGAAPGRVNLIGEHTDYNNGFVFPAAIDKDVWIAARPTDGPSRVFSEELGAGQEFDVNTVQPGEVEGWAFYSAGIGWALRRRAGKDLPNIEAYIHGEVPIASGISSSAAVELSFCVVWNELGGLGLPNKELAKESKNCENGFIGLKSGIMDQMASAMGKAGHALFLDTLTLDIEYAPIPDELTIVLCDTGTPRALAGSKYNERKEECEKACEFLGVESLRDATIEMLESKKADMPDVIYRRAKHVITENARCFGFKDALQSRNMVRVGLLMKASHESLRHDYEVSSPELDMMAEAAWHAPGCMGARMTGAGFGGACVALVENERCGQFVEYLKNAYHPASQARGNFIVCQAADGARIIK